MKIPGRIKALIVMAVVIYVLGHVVRAMALTLTRPLALLPSPRRFPRLGREEDKTLKHCTRC